jgi:hypothetical protein
VPTTRKGAGNTQATAKGRTRSGGEKEQRPNLGSHPKKWGQWSIKNGKWGIQFSGKGAKRVYSNPSDARILIRKNLQLPWYMKICVASKPFAVHGSYNWLSPCFFLDFDFSCTAVNNDTTVSKGIPLEQ